MEYDRRNTKKTSLLDDLCINTIKILTIDAVQKANSGHPGAPMGLAAAGYTLWTKVLKHNPKNPDWPDRDRFVLSGGHASMLLYSLLYLTGYNIELDQIKNFRQLNSGTPGHPEYGQTPGVESSTGPLGQGIANAVGMAIAERHLAAKFNRPRYHIVDHYVYVFCGDGDLMEGVSAEAASIAGHLGLSKLICLYDSNNISIEGNTNVAFTEDVYRRFLSYGWHVLKIEDGSDPVAIEYAFDAAQKEKNKPSILIAKTYIAHGSPNLQGNAASHGAPLGEHEVRCTKKALSWPEDENFFVPEEVLLFCRKCLEKGMIQETRWMELFGEYSKKYPSLADEWVNGLTRHLPEGWSSSIYGFRKSEVHMATRVASGKILNLIAKKIPNLIGGSADLAPSNKTYMDDSYDFQKKSYGGRNIRFGVREFAMGAIMSGMFLHGGLRPYGGTFLVFSDYMRPAIRMASIMKLPVIYIFTHDSIAVGEDGPTHQPVEHLAALRTVPGLVVIRPADANETVEAWKFAMEIEARPVALVLGRQSVPILDSKIVRTRAQRGAYIISDCNGKPDVLIIATGSEVHVSIKAKEVLKDHKIEARVISMPSWEIFEEQSDNYKKTIFPPEVKYRIIVEAGIEMGWSRYIENKGFFIGVNDFGVSAPETIVMKEFGFTTKNIVNKIVNLLNRQERQT